MSEPRIPAGAFIEAANYEDVFHPLRPGSSKPIRAWKMRGMALAKMREAANEHEERLAKLEEAQAAELTLLRSIEAKLNQLLVRPW